MSIDRYAKAITGALVAALGMYQSARAGGVSVDEWIDIAAVTLAALGAIWAVPNASGKVETQVVNAQREYPDSE